MFDDNRDGYDLGREIERSQLFRGEYDKFFEARGTAFLLFSGIVQVSFIVGLLIHSL